MTKSLLNQIESDLEIDFYALEQENSHRQAGQWLPSMNEWQRLESELEGPFRQWLVNSHLPLMPQLTYVLC